MSQIYGIFSSAPTRVDCTLVASQRYLVRAGFRESRNYPRADGWGAVVYDDETPHVEKKVIQEPGSLIFRGDLRQRAGNAAIAHVRFGVTGKGDRKNIHPFVHDSWSLAHHGAIENFHTIRRELLGELTPDYRKAIEGSTDSEHILYLFLSYLKRSAGSIAGDAPIHRIRDALVKSLQMLEEWSSRTRTRLNSKMALLLTNRRVFLAYSMHAPIYYLIRTNPIDCPICLRSHVEGEAGSSYRSVVFCSSPLSAEKWIPVPAGSVVLVDPDLEITETPIEA